MFLLVYMYGRKERWNSRQWLKQWKIGLFFIYFSFMLVSQILSRPVTNPYRYVFLHFGFRSDVTWNIRIIENILLFIPYILLFLFAFQPKRPWATALMLSAVSTCVIELSQLLFWLGDFQFSDIFHNILGGMIGCAIWYAIHTIQQRKIRRKGLGYASQKQL